MNFQVLQRTPRARSIAKTGLWIHTPTWRAISTRSAINKGLRAGRDDGQGERGGQRTPRRLGFEPASRSGRPGQSSLGPSSSRPGARDRREQRSGRSGAFSSPSANRDGPRRKLDFEPDARPSRTSRNTGFSSDRRRLSSGSPDRPDERRNAGPSYPLERRLRASPEEDTKPTPMRQRPNRMPLSALNIETDGRKPWQVKMSARLKKHDSRREGMPSRDEVTVSTRETSSSGGLMRSIKSACIGIQTLQQLQADGQDFGDIKLAIEEDLSKINQAVKSGSFKNDSPSEAVTDLFQKKSADGAFLIGRLTRYTPSVIHKKINGTFQLYIGQPEDRGTSQAERAGRDRKEEEDSASRPSRVQRQSEPRRDKSTEGPEDDGIPVSIPYTTAASEFLYGYNPVLAALKGARRQLYKLYIHPKIFPRESTGHSNSDRPAYEFVTLAKAAGVPFVNEFHTSKLDKMSDGRPHNGVVLEVSKLPAPPVLSLGKPDTRRSLLPMFLAKQSAEEAKVNGTSDVLSIATNTWRHPLVVMLDGILDPANVGSIIRSCHFYGIEAVAVATNTCANLSSSIVAKASSGGCEAVRLLALPRPSDFIYESAKAGWKIYAAASETGSSGKPLRLTTSAVGEDSPLAKHPCILMLGAEGEGLRENLKRRADAFVSINGSERPSDMKDVGVDSLNVGVATGVLLESFLRKPAGVPAQKDTFSELGW